MADAQRNVSVILNILPGDMSAVKAAIKELQEMRGITDEIAQSTAKVKAETESLAKVEVEAAKQAKELLNAKQDEVKIEERASNQKIDLKRREAEEEIRIERETARQVDEIRRPLREPRSVRPLREPDGTVPGLIGGPRAGGSGTTDLSEISAAIEAKIDADFKAFEENEKRKTDAARREAEKRAAQEERDQARLEEIARRTIQRIREAEVQHARERREEAERAAQDMPRHWRNVGLNAGQAVASAARFVGHMRMLKNVGGEALEDVARRFMTIQSRVETIAASTSFFTNVGTMTDGLRLAGQEMQLIVNQQMIMGQAATATQAATIGIGRAAASVMPFIAPMQLAFTAITAAIVAADIAMDFFGQSTEETEQKNAKWTAEFNKNLDDIIAKLHTETELMKGQTEILKTQWEIQELIAGDDGLDPDKRQMMNEQTRKRRDIEATKEIHNAVTDVFQQGLDPLQKAKQRGLEDKREQLMKEAVEVGQELSVAKMEAIPGPYSPRRQGKEDAVKMAQFRLDQIEKQMRELEQDQIRLDVENGKKIQDALKAAVVKDGVIDNLPEILKTVQNPPAQLGQVVDKVLNKLQEELGQNMDLLVDQAKDARQRTKAAQQSKSEQESKRDQLIERQQSEIDVAERFKLEDSKFAMTEADRLLTQISGANNVDDRKRAADELRNVLGRSELMTSDIDKAIGVGTATDAKQVKEAITDAQEVTPGERKEYDDLITKASDAITKAEENAESLAAMAEQLVRKVEQNAKHLEMLERALENRDLN